MRPQQVKRRPWNWVPGSRAPSRGRRRVRLATAGLLLVAAACAPVRNPPQAALPASIEDAEDFLNVLRGAGVPVQATSALAPPGFGGKGQVVQIGKELVQVYSYATVEDRRDDSRSIAVGQWPSGDPIEAGLSVWTAGRLIVTYGGTDGGTHLLLEAVLGDPITRAAEVVDEPYPAAVPVVLAEAADLWGLAATSIEVIGLEEATWPDSCLGLPRAEETCSPGAVPGWNILVRGGDVRARYRTDVGGEVVRLEETMDEP